MIGWIVLALLALLVLLWFTLRVGVTAGYDQEGGWVRAKLGPKTLQLYPPPAKKPERPKKQKKPKKKKKAPKPEGDRGKGLVQNLGGALELGLELLPLLQEAAGKFRRKLRIDTLYLRLLWAEEDPADAAIHYGWAWAVTENLLSFLEAGFDLRDRDVALYLDYFAPGPKAYLRAGFSLTLAQLAGIALPLAVGGLKVLLEQKKQRRKAAAGPSPAGEKKGVASDGKESSC